MGSPSTGLWPLLATTRPASALSDDIRWRGSASSSVTGLRRTSTEPTRCSLGE
jgi:hypothetical protein